MWKKIIFLMCLLVGIASGSLVGEGIDGGLVGSTGSGKISSTISSVSKCVIAYPDGQHLNTVYDKTDSWNLDADEWGCVLLMSGVYDLGTTKLLMDNSRVKLVGEPPVKITSSETVSDHLIEVTAYQWGMENIEVYGTADNGDVLINNTATGTGSTTFPPPDYTFTLASAVDGVQPNDWFYVYTSGTVDGQWCRVDSVNSSTSIEVSEVQAFNGSYEYELVSMDSHVRNCQFYIAGGSVITFVKNLGGTWRNCSFGDGCLFTEIDGDIYDIVADMAYITAGDKFMGLDQGNSRFEGKLRFFDVGSQFLGCTGYGGGLGTNAVISNGHCGDFSIALGRRIESGAIVSNVIGGNDCFAGSGIGTTYSNGSYTSGNSTITFSNSHDGAQYGRARGRDGLVVYLSGASISNGYYEILSVNTGTNEITFTSDPTTGTDTDCEMAWGVGEIGGTVINCYATDADSFASQNDTAPARVLSGGAVLNCYNGTTAISDIAP